MPRALEVKPLEGFRLKLRYNDGTEGEIDLSYLKDRGVFTAWKDPGVFDSVRIGENGEIVWTEEVELCPDALYLQLTGKRAEEVFPSLRNSRVDA